MAGFFNLSPSELNSKIRDLESIIQRSTGPFYKPTKNDWSDIFSRCKEIADEFKGVRFATKEERNQAWDRFNNLRSRAYESRISITKQYSDKYYDELMSRLQSVDYSKLADFLVGDIMSFGAMKTTADEIRSSARGLREIVEYYHKVKYELTKEHSARVQESITQVRQHHNDFWNRYKSYQEEKSKAYELKKKANEEYKKEKERKQKEWEARRAEKVRRQKEWEAKKIERERKQKEWEARKVERERKQREWEARQVERERKKREWEARQAERERKQREWEARKSERERKQREWEARQAEYQREKERRQREYEERQRERARRNAEYQERKSSRRDSGKRNKGGCYITTAVCSTLGKSDDCEELTLIRSFRDNWLLYQDNGLQIIENYYFIAPEIVLLIDQERRKDLIYKGIWKNYLKQFYTFIKYGNYTKALRVYLKMVSDLEKTFIKVLE